MTIKKTITLTTELELVIAKKQINFNAYVNKLIKEDLFKNTIQSKTDIDLTPLTNKNEIILKEILIANDNIDLLLNENEEIKSQYKSIENAIMELLKANNKTAELLLKNTSNINKLCEVLNGLNERKK